MGEQPVFNGEIGEIGGIRKMLFPSILVAYNCTTIS
jgi:hypothetical protein